MNEFHLEIISPDGQVFAGEVEEVSIPTENGEISILPHHADLYSKVVPGETIVQKKGKKEFFAVLGGFVEVQNGTVTILSDYALSTDKISEAKAREAKAHAEKLLQDKDSEKNYELIEKNLQRSILELNIAEKAKKRRTVQ